jgi:hypothetical protein
VILKINTNCFCRSFLRCNNWVSLGVHCVDGANVESVSHLRSIFVPESWKNTIAAAPRATQWKAEVCYQFISLSELSYQVCNYFSSLLTNGRRSLMPILSVFSPFSHKSTELSVPTWRIRFVSDRFHAPVLLLPEASIRNMQHILIRSRVCKTWRFEFFTAVTMKNAVFLDIQTQFVLHRKHFTSPLQSPAG